ncbi:MAG: cobalamin-dependent protein [Planctomycetota bacterium]|jgi:anaerobic magnesium-protoporphyrin IX monomethyl ester cyclase
MKVMLINPPYQTLTSNLGVGHQVPLGLLMVGGAMIDAGFKVELLDAEALRLSLARIVDRVGQIGPRVIMTGHAGSTPAHPVCMQMLKAIKRAHPEVTTVYGGVFPTYHAEMILRKEPAVDVIVRGEGGATARELVVALATNRPGDTGSLLSIAGIACRVGARIVATAPREPIKNLDTNRVGWELIDDWERYQCFGRGRAAIVQFSRGCPHRCTYCGQHGFWTKWRHRDPVRLAEEIAWLHHRHDVRFITLADENPTTLKREWRRFLEELIKQDIDVHFFATIRAPDIVRDGDILDLYRRAGIWADFFHALRALVKYDGDLLNVMYVTPHSWTRFAHEAADREVVQEDQRRWDYRHQVLGQRRLTPWQLFAAVKWLELVFHLRPSRIWRLIWERDPFLRNQLGWTAIHISAVWLGEIVEFLSKTRFARAPQPLRAWLRRFGHGAPQRPDMSTKAIPLSIRGRRIARTQRPRRDRGFSIGRSCSAAEARSGPA